MLVQFAPHLNKKREHQTDKFHICTGEMNAFPINSQVASTRCEVWALSTMKWLYVVFALYVTFAASENPDGKTYLYLCMHSLYI